MELAFDQGHVATVDARELFCKPRGFSGITVLQFDFDFREGRASHPRPCQAVRSRQGGARLCAARGRAGFAYVRRAVVMAHTIM
jgi:hypothetical protein